ncbi:flagellar hook-basal body complex protein FliE [Sansalvadorimonas sp. 2012CJ34-2]|uniref:Flagellar hook-basal body complex protein FliE n=1 Tax=Parendozoicomonas callyspongiae TaxID=2942213 RepID=A0ABT0PFG8_9GAMM|nr:flagellar hook-basal body complex protein FliE [Sansalvadorimonas sp. 2012CJ34-2]MCL6270125.1 flagellar hook-basal body complex protein FliE [Sansalvadorimonas sp. 2012CJ34-2]
MIDNKIALSSLSNIDVASLESKGIEKRDTQGQDFGTYLKQALEHVNDLQMNADEMRTDYETGASDDLAGVMIAGQKASLAFQGLMQVRNRVVSAYETVFNMPV